jgi:dipeptidyl aminopeptidase/acylaminoacyl peptidase
MEDNRKLASYGSWASLLSAQTIGATQVAFGNLRHANNQLYWTENVPAARGNLMLYAMGRNGVAVPLTAPTSNVRTRVHEYGGAPYVVVGDMLYYSEFADQLLYALSAGGTSTALTPAGYRYADCIPVASSGASADALIGVREDHTDPANVRNSLVRIALTQGGPGEVLYAGSDFVAYPRLSPDGTQLAFVAWNHPHMPWDASELKVARWDGQRLEAPVTVAGGTGESVLEPQWDVDGTLYFISDRSGFWNLYTYRSGTSQAIWPRAAECASALWTLGQANFALLGNARMLLRFAEDGIDQLALLDLERRSAQILDLPYVEYSQLTRIDHQNIAMLAAPADAPRTIARLDLSNGDVQTLRTAPQTALVPTAVSVAVPIEFPSGPGRRAHAFYYPPVNPAFRAPAGTTPPLLTRVHGGPTSQASPAFATSIQFWTSRGFAVLDVNYGGSTGYGRAYRRELAGNWGVLDVQDVIAAARELTRTGRADPLRSAISGGSAGGFTVLAALSTSDVFRAGANYYGVSDMTALARDTHKFESRYLDSLIGVLPEAQAIYDSRSPLNHLDGFRFPLIVFQGAEDPIVPPSQSERIVDALRQRGIPLVYQLYAGESHGFRKPENIILALQSELSFYGQVFGFEPADDLPPLNIENLPAQRGR